MKPQRSFALLVFFLIFALGIGLSARAAPPNAAEQYIEGLGREALAILNLPDSEKTQKQAALQRLFLDNVDISWISRFAVGPYWRQATQAQQKRYQAQYEHFLLKHYVAHFADYGSGDFTVAGSQDAGDGETLVTMHLRPDLLNRQDIAVAYRVRQENAHGQSRFRIFDVIVEGVSLLATQRQEFCSIIASNGFDYLIEQLERKSQDMNLHAKITSD